MQNMNKSTDITDLYYVLTNKKQGRLKEVIQKEDNYWVLLEWQPKDGRMPLPFLVVLEPNDEKYLAQTHSSD